MKVFIPAIIWALIIFWASTTSGKNLPSISWNLFEVDKLAHAIVYFILSVLIIKGFMARDVILNSSILYGVLISIVYGILLEIIQFTFFPYRYFELLDIIANIIGSIGSIVVFKIIYK